MRALQNGWLVKVAVTPLIAMLVAACGAKTGGLHGPAPTQTQSDSTSEVAAPPHQGDVVAQGQENEITVFGAGKYGGLTVTGLRDGSDFVVRASVINKELRYNTPDGDHPVRATPGDLGLITYHAIGLNVLETYHNATGQTLDTIIALGELELGDSVMIGGQPTFEAGQEGIFFGKPVDTELAAMPAGQYISSLSLELGAYPASVGLWCPISGGRVMCLPVHVEMPLQQMESEIAP